MDHGVPAGVQAQRTLRDSVSLCGRGLHTGAWTQVRIGPAEPGAGISFERLDVAPRRRLIRAHWSRLVSHELCTTLGNEHGITVGTVEHLLAALVLAELDNVLITIDGPEVPILDGSAAPFLDALLRTGSVAQNAARRVLRVMRPVSLRLGQRYALATPSQEPSLTATIEFPDPLVGCQSLSMRLYSPVSHSIAAARTFGFVAEVGDLLKRGLGRGGSLENAVLVHDGRVLNKEGLRFPDEFVRHKILDCIGDLALMRARVMANFRFERPGHQLNQALVSRLATLPDAVRWDLDYSPQPLPAGLPSTPCAPRLQLIQGHRQG